MQTITTLLQNINKLILNPAIYLLFGIALVVFLWGVVQFVANADNEEARSLGRKHILWGIVGMFIMVSAFGILNAVLGTFHIDNSALNNVKGGSSH